MALYGKRTSQVNGGCPWPDGFPPDFHVGNPSTGGVWVLKVPSGEFEPDDFGKVVMAFTMDERCATLEEMGATFYANVDECSDVAKSLKDWCGDWETMGGADEGDGRMSALYGIHNSEKLYKLPQSGSYPTLPLPKVVRGPCQYYHSWAFHPRTKSSTRTIAFH